MGKTTTEKQNNMSNNGVDDHGKMRWVGEITNRKSFITTIPKYTGTEWLEKEHKRSDWRRTLEMNNKWLWIQWLGANTAIIQPNWTKDVESPDIVEN